MWTHKLQRTKDGAAVTVPRSVLRVWDVAGAAFVHMIYSEGELRLVPYTRDLRRVVPHDIKNAEARVGDPLDKPGPD